MAQNYTRQSSFADGDTITAALFNNEFNQVVNAFSYSASSDSSTGHKHDGTAGQGGNIPQIGDIDFLNKIVVDNTNNRWGFYVQVSSGTVEQLRIQDGAIVPVTDDDIDLGTSSLEFKDLFLDGTAHIDTLDVDVNATVAGTLGVTGATTLSSTLGVTGATTLSSTLGVTGAITGSSTLQATTITATTAFVPDASDGASLGTSALEFSDLFLADGAVINFGTDQDVSLTHVADTGLLLNSTMALQFNDASQYINAPSATVLDINATDEIELNATLVDVNANLDVSGTVTATGTSVFASLDISGDIDVDGTTNLDVVDIDGAVNIAAATTIATDNKIQFRDTAIYVNSSTDGQLDIVADTEVQIAATTVDINGAVDISGNLDVGGNLVVTGTTTFNGGTLTMGDAATDNVVFGADINSNIIPNTDDTYDLGSSSQEWRNLYIDGTANIDSLVADTADINGGTIDGATIATSDITVGSGKTLNVSAGTLTLADDQISGDKVEGGTIAATTITTLTSTTGNITSVNATTVDTTNLEVTTLKAKDGTAAGSIADSTGVVTLASSVLTTTDINGGTIDGVTIGGSSAGDITYANLSDGTITITAFVDEDDMSSDSATLVPTQQSVKAYVDAQVTAQDLDIVGDTGTDSIDLDSETITFTGGTGITSVVTTGTVTHNIDSTVATLTGSQTLTNKSLTAPTLTGTAIVASLDISGDIDVDGTTNLDVVDIDGAVDMASTALVTGVLTTTAATVFNGGFASNAASTITTADNLDTLSLISTDADASVGPNLRLYRNSGSPADSDALGRINAVGRNDASQDVIYSTIETYALDVSDGTESAVLNFNVMQAGTSVSFFKGNNTEVVVNDDSKDLDFRVESDGNANMLFVDGGNDRVGIGRVPSISNSKLEVGGADNVSLINVEASGNTGGMGIGSTGLQLFHGASSKVLIGSGGMVVNEASADYDFRVESNGNANMLFVDGGADLVGIGTGSPIALDGNAAPGLTISSNGPFICLQDANNADKVNYISNNTGVMQFGIVGDNGASGKTEVANFSSVGAIFNDGGLAANDFRVESDSNANMLFVDAGNNRVGIATGSPGSALQVGDATYNDGTITVVDSIGFNSSSNLNPSLNRWALRARAGGVEGNFDIYNARNSIAAMTFGNSEVVANEDSGNVDFRVESNDNTHMLFVDGGANHVNIGIGTDYGGTLNVVTTDTSVNLVLASSDAGAASGPILDFHRNSSSPADNDVTGHIRFRAENDTDEAITYAEIITVSSDVSNASEDSTMYIQGMVAGTVREKISMFPTETVLNDNGVDLDFRVESDNNANMLFVDGGNNVVVVGGTTAETGDTFEVISADATTNVRIRNTNAGATGPVLIFDKSSASPANDDDLGDIRFIGKDSAGNAEQYARLLVESGNITSGGEDGFTTFNMMVNGTDTNMYTMNHVGTTFNEGGDADLDFRVESSGNANMLFVDGGSNFVGIGSNTGNAKLYVLNDGGTELPSIRADNNIASYTAHHIWSVLGGADNDNTTAIHVAGYTASGNRFVIFGNGNMVNTNNSYGALSDVKLKENIIDASSQWDDIKAVTIRKYSMKEDNLDAPNMLGVIAQELEAAGMGGLVFESPDRDSEGKILDTTTKQVNYSILYMKAVKALQEAMERIESLESRITALES
jgi:hypothetical protein